MNQRTITNVPMTTLTFNFVIGIPTFKRPKQLTDLLESLLSELSTQAALIIVADNDCDTNTLAIVNAFKCKWPYIIYLPISERGISMVRNSLILKANIEMPDWHWLVMLDDDGIVTQNWLLPLLSTGERLNAHLVSGPVITPIPGNSNCFARNSIYGSRIRQETGVVKFLNGAQNLGLSKRCFDLNIKEFFNLEYGLSGGEDYELFRKIIRAGGVLAWCDEALVIEPPPESDLTTHALLYRYFTTGAYMSCIDQNYDGLFKSWLLAIKGVISSIVQTTKGIASFDTDQMANGILMIAHYFGRTAGLLGTRTSRYGSK